MEDASQLVLLNPDKAVTFLNVPKRQRACLTITNYSNCQITFKMKSTNPRLFRMNPVYGIIGPRSEADVILTFKGCLPRISPSDRFTVVIAFLTGQLNNASQAWKDRKMKQSLEMSSFKKRIKVQYLSERTTISPSYEVEEDDLVGNVQKARVLKRRGLVEDDVAYHCTDPVLKERVVLKDQWLVQGNSLRDR
ncbi:hypothetical protein Q1695_010977 [Nippostrongylus brasiliensis]|nr:hypothetical protein Q1695_010977 [Nippostrongylus brasiliensis]